MSWEAVFFDFDGVILDSVNIKTEAFGALFRKYGPDVEEAVVNYHLANGGVSRYKKFEYYYKHLLHKDLKPDKMEGLGKQFNQLVMKRVLEAAFIPGAMDTLKHLKRKNIPSFVVSGTPHQEMKTIVKRRQLDRYFVEVHGAPREKNEIVEDIAGRHGFKLINCIFVGDAKTDYEAAMHCGTSFLGIVLKEQKSPFPDGTSILDYVKII